MAKRPFKVVAQCWYIRYATKTVECVLNELIVTASSLFKLPNIFKLIHPWHSRTQWSPVHTNGTPKNT